MSAVKCKFTSKTGGFESYDSHPSCSVVGMVEVNSEPFRIAWFIIFYFIYVFNPPPATRHPLPLTRHPLPATRHPPPAEKSCRWCTIQFWYTNMAAGNQQKHLEFTFSTKALSFHSRASIRAYKHNFKYLKWLNCWKSRGEILFQRDNSPILVSRTVETRKFKLLYFWNETCYGTGNLYKDLLFVYLQPFVKKNSWNLAILTLQINEVTVKPSF